MPAHAVSTRPMISIKRNRYQPWIIVGINHDRVKTYIHLSVEAGLDKWYSGKYTDYFQQDSPTKNHLQEHTASHRTPSVEYLAYLFSVLRKVKAVTQM